MPEARQPRLSPSQQRLWFHQQLAPESNQYNVFRGYELRGPLDAAALGRALGALADRHVALRMRFPAEAGSPRVAVTPVPCLVDLPRAGLAPDGWEAEASAFARRWSSRPFDLGREEPMRAHLLGVASDLHVLLLCVHHIVIDGWSVPILDEELGRLYAAEAGGEPAGLPPLRADYLDYADWQRKRAGSPAAERVLGYWRERLAGVPELVTLPADRTRPRLQGTGGGQIATAMPKDVADLLASFAAGRRLTPYTVAYAAFAVLLGRYARADDLVLGVVVAGRSRPEFARTVGFFVGTLPVRMDLSGDPGFRTVLARAREALFDAYDNDLLPLDVLVDRLEPRRDPSYAPLVQVIFQMLVLPQAGEARWGEVRARVWGEELTAPATRFDLEVHLLDRAGGELSVEACFNADLFDEETVARLIDDYFRLLRALCENPDQPISRTCAAIGGGEAEVAVSIRDTHGVPLPLGVPGEAWLAGNRTGLLARIRADGTVEFLGGVGEELVVRGLRVPARLIEEALLADRSIAAAEVTAGDGGGLAARLRAVPGLPRPAAGELRARLRRRLPGFLVPGSFTWEGEPDAPVVFFVPGEPS
ncbi:pipecolate-incorporating enzyme [Nonomuraea solani]|uniref:Pipecolate-incorporating enzyme n=1 Tax=Nonomuraea solani TaxID=1144553 RepID=A0A1H6F166_9ACTN|nr:condensation domain-containing protein [Nonomuraea solani]SEH02929.1 pipecolate-incorporating enzyme [Nonomuraea solani]